MQNKFTKDLCSERPNTFWKRKIHTIYLPYESDFKEKDIPTKARPIQMNKQHLDYFKKEIQDYLEKCLIRPSKSPWSCSAFYVVNAAELERGSPRLVINYKPLNKVLQWIMYLIPNKKYLINILHHKSIFSKFDLKSEYYQIQLEETDKYKTAFVVSFGHYEWNVLPLGLRNNPSEFQNIMNSIFNDYSHFTIVYLDDILVFSDSINKHLQHLNQFYEINKDNDLVLSEKKLNLFQSKVRFLGFDISQGMYTHISRSLEFVSKFPDELKEKTQLQRFLGCLNYFSDFIPNLRTICIPLFKRLRKNPPPWNDSMTKSVIQLKQRVKILPYQGIYDPNANLIVEVDASELGLVVY